MATGSADKNFLKKFADLGINFFTSGSDYDFLREGALKNIKELKEME